MALNNDIIERNIDSNYELATSMENLNSTVAKQAIISKMTSDQGKMIRGMATHENADIDAITATAASMTEALVNQNADNFSQQLSTQEYSGWEIASDFINPLDDITDAIGDIIFI